MILEGKDLFCGAGGFTTGLHDARVFGKRVAVVHACVNHDEVAMSSHKANYPETFHIPEDMANVGPDSFPALDPNIPFSFVVASPDCTYHTRAGGGISKKADARSQANFLLEYGDKLRPHYIVVENVREFRGWGPVRIKCTRVDDGPFPYSELAVDARTGEYMFVPVKHLKGTLYQEWVAKMKALGYEYDHRLLNAADFGGYTSRIRYFGCFARIGFPIVWPQPTHAKKPVGHLKPWKAVRDVLELDNHGKSIFSGPKQKSENTLKRVYDGCITHIGNGDESFLVKYHGTGRNILPLSGPASTLTQKDRLALTSVQFLDKQYSGKKNHQSLEVPGGTITKNPKLALVTGKKLNSTQFLYNPQYSSKGSSINDPCFTLIARMDKAPPHLITVETGEPAIVIYDTDSEYTRKIKLFMVEYGIVDICMRMLTIPELKRIQGFPDDYILHGTQQDQKRFIGNSVPPVIPKAWTETLARTLMELFPQRLTA